MPFKPTGSFSLVHGGPESSASSKQVIKWGSFPVNLSVAGDPSMDGEFSLAQWNQDVSSSSSSITSTLVVVLLRESSTCLDSLPEVES